MASNASPPAGSGTHSRQSFVRRHLDPTESLGEVLFGLIMVLTFTLGAGLITEGETGSSTRMLLGILGCNVAWGIIDGAIYVISSMFDRSRKARLLQSIRKASSEEEALAMVGRELDSRLEPFTSPEDRRRLYPAVLKRLENIIPERTHVKKEDICGAIAVFWLVFYSTIPAIVPFLVFRDHFVALRVSNFLLLIMLFLVGYRWARATNSNPWIFATILLVVGLVMVAIVTALGG